MCEHWEAALVNATAPRPSARAALANAEARVIVTFDLGFSRTLALTRNAGPSIVLFRLEKYSTSDINHRLALIVERHMEPLRSGAIVTVDPGRVRVRLLPIQ